MCIRDRCNDKRVFMDVKSIPSVSLDSDHRLVVGKIRWRQRKKPKKVTRERYCFEKLKDENTREDFNNKLVRKYEEISGTVERVEEGWKDFREGVEQVAREVIGTKKISSGKRKKTVWWNEEVKNVVKEKNKKYRLWMKTRTEENRQAYVMARNQAEIVKRRNIDLSWERIGELEEDMRSTRKLIYGMAKRLRTKDEPNTNVIFNKDREPIAVSYTHLRAHETP